MKLYQKYVLPILLVLAMGISWLPVSALAEEVPAEQINTEETIAEETAPATKETVPETEPASAPAETVPAEPALLSAEPVNTPGPGLYFGQLHGHSNLSDGTVSPEEAFSAAARSGMDFLALTDHGDSLSDADWAAGKSAAGAAAVTNFVGIFGYEMNWPARMQIGHIGAFSASGFTSWQEGFDAYGGALERYYAAMAADRAIGQFNHPGTQYGNFCDFSQYSEAADSFMRLLETDGGITHYVKALDRGWHVAPTWTSDSRDGRFGAGRTAVYAESLTEEGLYDALRSRRVYATEDSDLEILYTLDGYDMGSIAEDVTLGETADLFISLSDPTDSALGLVEVIGDGGAVLGSAELSTSSDSLTFSLPVEYRYYFLRVTQPDGDIAVTAPVWVSHTEDLGIAALTCETAVPVQNEEITLNLALYNRENADFLVDSLEILADGEGILTDAALTKIPANSSFTHTLTVSCGCLGQTTLTARLRGTLNEEPRTYEASLSLSFRQSSLVTDMLVTGVSADDLNTLKTLAAEADIRVNSPEELTAEALENCRILVVSAPEEPFSEAFLDLISDYAAYGGSVVVCGWADTGDGDVHAAFQLNRVLSALGSSLRLRDDTVRDAVTNGGSEDVLYLDKFNTDAVWCGGLSRDQVYRLASGCTVEPGGGQWLVRGRDTTHSADGDDDGLGGQTDETVTILACEELISGGTVFAAGSLFFSDDSIAPPEHSWDAPYANCTIVHNLLSLGDETLPLRTVAEARSGETGELFRVRGYVTAGTANPYNTFPNTIYLQDDTGGIAVTLFTQADIRVGTPLEITGYADIQEGNRVLKTISAEVLDAALYQYQPKTGGWKDLLDYSKNGGLLVEIEGECTDVSCREDGTVSGILLKNSSGQTARVLIEDAIFSGATGKNTLRQEIRKGRTVRAMGLLHVDASGETVLRVRNCDEVVYVPPKTYINPKTGDPILGASAVMLLSCEVLLLLKKKKIV